MAKSTEKDPTIKKDRVQDSSLDGVHPALPVSEADDSAEGREYKDNPDKPDPSSIAQVEVVKDEDREANS